MKILYITPWFPSKPEDQHGSYIIDSIRSLIALGVEVHVLYVKTWRPRNKKIDKSLFVDVPLIRECSYFSFPRHFCRVVSNFMLTHRVASVIKKMHGQYHYDLIHAHTELCALPLLKLNASIPTVCTIHGIDTCHRMWSGRSGKLIFRAIESVNKLIMVGAPLLKHFEPKLKITGHIALVYNGFRESLLQAKPTKDNKIINIVSVSNLVEGKGIEINIEALSQLNQRGIKNWQYTIVGDGVEKGRLESLVKRYHLQEKVCFVGAQPHDKVYEYLQASDVFSLPSYREAFGIAYVEAMAHGLLTLGVEGQGAEAFIKPGETGFLMKPNNVDDLVRLLQYVMSHIDVLGDIRKKGKESVFKNFSWKNHGERLLSIYQVLV
jgi:teichuronic acid biosynthesis glycosyltransferase TuaC